MVDHAMPKPVEAAVPAVNRSAAQATCLAPPPPTPWSVVRGQRSLRAAGFTLAELLVSVGVLVLLVLLATQLLNSAATITTLGHKQMDADSQARQLLDRMAIDFAQMVKRSDVDYDLKSSSGSAADCANCGPQAGNDLAIFYSMVPGYYSMVPAPTTTQRSPISIVAYRVNFVSSSSTYLKMERLGKGLAWNGVSLGWTPIWFLPKTILEAILSTASSEYEVVGPRVFRFEYYYLLKNGGFSDIPWDTSAGHNAVDGMQDVSAIVVDIAVIDPKSKVLLNDAQIATFTTSGAANFLSDYASGMVPGQLRAQWQNTLNGITSLPRPALSGIRLYERHFYLSPPTLLTP